MQLSEILDRIDRATNNHFPVVIAYLIAGYARGVRLEFSSNQLFSGGLFEYLGTDGFTQEWRNPATDPRLVWMTHSKLEGAFRDWASGCVEGCIQMHSKRGLRPTNWTELSKMPNAWVAVDLGPDRSFFPTHYTLMVWGMATPSTTQESID